MDRNSYTNYHWSDTKRILGMPISCTRYYLSDNALCITTGLFSRHTTDILLYRIDVSGYNCSLLQRIANQGTIKIRYKDMDHNWKTLYIENVKDPEQVKNMIHTMSQKSKLQFPYWYDGYPFPP